jgi:2-amino-4-hydroxy-6-hydroxymethyldihydropteridine diphosphokinase
MSAVQKNVFVGAGSNIDPERNVVDALVRLRRHARVTATSTLYWTAPVGRSEQARFLNGVWRIETSLAARQLKFDVLRNIESDLGRLRTADKCAPRTIDLDIVLYGHLVVDEADLRIPDPDIRQRPFIAIPLLELDPDLILPDTGERLADLPVVRRAEGLETATGLTARLRAILEA